MATLTQQATYIKNTILEPITQRRFPLVHVLTSKTDNDDEKV